MSPTRTKKPERLSPQEVERLLDEAKMLIQQSKRSLKQLQERTGIRIVPQRRLRLRHVG